MLVFNAKLLCIIYRVKSLFTLASNKFTLHGNTRVSPLVELLPDEREKMTNRRAGIEPLIGHLKRGWQMGKSKMKYDETTKAAGYCAVLGLNLRQLMRNLAGEVKTNTG